jgi:hypothetical protein
MLGLFGLWVMCRDASDLGDMRSKTEHTANFFFVSTEDDPLLHGANIEDSHGLVA